MPTSDGPGVPVSFRCPADLHAHLADAARGLGLNASAVIILALNAHLPTLLEEAAKRTEKWMEHYRTRKESA